MASSYAVLVLACSEFLFTNSLARHAEYIIIGAGPAGLQLGHHLDTAGRDYVILDQAHGPGSFYHKFPRHRKFISLNKWNTPYSNPEYNLRFDWNSILSNDSTLTFPPHFSTEYFPEADDYVRYLEEYQRRLNIRTEFGVKVWDVMKGMAPARFVLNTSSGEWTANYLIAAIGMGLPEEVPFKGKEYVEYYDDF